MNVSQALATWFAYPALLAALAVPPLLAMLFVAASFLRRRALGKLGSPPAIRRLTLLRPAGRRWRAFCLLNGLTLLAFACAGPQWGKAFGHSRAARGDLVVA